jgi:hypothetical protein
VGKPRTTARGISPDARRRQGFPCSRRRPRDRSGIHAEACRGSERTRTRPPSWRTDDAPLMAHRLAPRAETDLDEIWYYTAKESGSIEIANRLIDSITDRFSRLPASRISGFPAMKISALDAVAWPWASTLSCTALKPTTCLFSVWRMAAATLRPFLGADSPPRVFHKGSFPQQRTEAQGIDTSAVSLIKLFLRRRRCSMRDRMTNRSEIVPISQNGILKRSKSRISVLLTPSG